MDRCHSTDCGDCPDDESAEREVDSLLRRRLLATAASTSALASAGCLGILGDGSETGPREEETVPYTEPTSTPGTPGGDTFAIEYVEQGATIDVASTENLLDAGLDEGFDMPYQCQVGVCGVCTSEVDGDGTELVEHDGADYLDDTQIEAGFVLPCVAEPRAEFSLTTGKKEAADSFTPGGQTDTPAETDTPSGTTYPIEYVEQGATIDVASTETLLDAGLDEDFEMPWQCGVGVCGQCTSEVDGDGDPTELVEHDGNDYLSDDQLAEGYVLTCVGSPTGEFSLTTGKKDEADQV